MTHLLTCDTSDPTNELHGLKKIRIPISFIFHPGCGSDNGLEQKCVGESYLILKAVVSRD